MTRRLLNLPVLLSLLALCVLAIVIVIAIRHVASPAIRDTHTRFVFSQLDEFYGSYLGQGNNPVGSSLAFLALVQRCDVDWNSCEFRAGSIFDSWGTAVQVRAGQGVVRLRSAGPDRRFDTPDDIAAELDGV